MDESQRLKIKALAHCTFRPGSYEKRFVRDLSGKPADYELTGKQSAYLDKLYWRYRRQISAAVNLDQYPPLVEPVEALSVGTVFMNSFGLLVEVPSGEAAGIPAVVNAPKLTRRQREVLEKLERWNKAVSGL